MNGLLVTSIIVNTLPRCASGGNLVPSFHKRCEPGHTVIGHFIR